MNAPIQEVKLVFANETSKTQSIAGVDFILDAYTLYGPNSTNLTASILDEDATYTHWTGSAMDASTETLTELTNVRGIPGRSTVKVTAASAITGNVIVRLLGRTD